MQDKDGQMEVMAREREDLEVIAPEMPTEIIKMNLEPIFFLLVSDLFCSFDLSSFKQSYPKHFFSFSIIWILIQNPVNKSQSKIIVALFDQRLGLC